MTVQCWMYNIRARTAINKELPSYYTGARGVLKQFAGSKHIALCSLPVFLSKKAKVLIENLQHFRFLTETPGEFVGLSQVRLPAHTPYDPPEVHHAAAPPPQVQEVPKRAGAASQRNISV